MAWRLDARVPVTVLPDLATLRDALTGVGPAALLLPAPLSPALAAGVPTGAAVVARDDFATAPHPAACTCCGGRPPAATALDRLFQARLRGTAPWFDRVLVLGAGDEARAGLDAAMRGDAVTAARFRMAD